MSSRAAQLRKRENPLRVRVRYTEDGVTVLVGRVFPRPGVAPAEGHAEDPVPPLRPPWDGFDGDARCNCLECRQRRVQLRQLRYEEDWRRSRPQPRPAEPVTVAGNRADVLAALSDSGGVAAAAAWRWNRAGRVPR